MFSHQASIDEEMTLSSKTILIFEDILERRNEYCQALVNIRGDRDYDVDVFVWEQWEQNKGSYESILTEALSEERRPAIVVSDHDLSQMDGRLTDDALEPVCQKLLIPLLRYAQRAPESRRERFARHIYGDLFLIHLSIEDGPEVAARDIVAYYEGFVEMREGVAAAIEKEILREGPATVLADILQRPEIRVDLTLFANSGPQMLAKTPPDPAFENDALAKATYNYGHWLLNSILRYPGVLLNEKAAAAYMNLDIQTFREPTVRKLFEAAKYSGPFSRVKRCWWRASIDAILDDENAQDGLELALTLGVEGAKPSTDSDSGEEGATYYCIVSGEPVTKDNSIGNLSWIPQGADLARISKGEYETWAPLLNQ